MRSKPNRHGRKLGRYYANAENFIEDILCRPDIDAPDYLPGREHIRFYSERLEEEDRIVVETHEPLEPRHQRHEFEEALFTRLSKRRGDNVLVLVGGLGAGKSTTTRFVLKLLSSRASSLTPDLCSQCKLCPRTPIVIDCLDLNPRMRRDKVINKVFKRIRFAVYNRLVEEWLASGKVEPSEVQRIDPRYKVLRRLIISNDLMRWEGPEYPDAVDLDRNELRLGKDIFAIKPTLDFVTSLVHRYRASVETLDADINRIAHNSDLSLDFISLLLKFYLSRCPAQSPLNLFVVDNLDHLPTGHIEALVKKLHDVAARIEGLPLLIPLRPSSITPDGFKRTVAFRYHYGPNNFELVLYRLEKHVLLQPRSQLLKAGTALSPFEAEPTSEEYLAFRFSTYVYARILADRVGQEQGAEGVLLPRLHEDHGDLANLELPLTALRDLGQTLDALVGVSCRYAFDQLVRYYRNVYSQSSFLPGVLLRLSRAEKLAIKLPIRFGLLVQSIVREPRKSGRRSRLANIFLPTRGGTNEGWPTLAKLRILHRLAERGRVKVREIVRRLASYGIPAEVTVEALNYMHDKYRLLIWFSNNTDLRLKDKHLDQYVVISEHGLAYHESLAGDFEYVWHCAMELGNRSMRTLDVSFPVKLQQYRELIQALGVTEWKQIAFRRCSSGTLPDTTGRFYLGELVVLSLLYSSMTRVLTSSEMALGATGASSEYRGRVDRLLAELCREILLWQERYILAFGGTGYLVRYSDQIDKIKYTLVWLLSKQVLSEGTQALANDLHRSWESDPGLKHLCMVSAENPLPPREDFITITAKLGRSIPGLEKFIGVLDSLVQTRVYLLRYLRTREDFAELLRSRLLTFHEGRRYLQYLVTGATAVIESCKGNAATGTDAFNWFLAEREWLECLRDRVLDNEYDIPEVCDVDNMSEYKRRCNNIMEAWREAGARLVTGKSWHLEQMWST